MDEARSADAAPVARDVRPASRPPGYGPPDDVADADAMSDLGGV